MSRRFSSKIKAIFFLISKGGGRCLLKEIQRRLYSTERSLCLRRNLQVPFKSPAAKIPLSIRPLREEDAYQLLDQYDSDIPGEAVKERVRRKLFLKEKIPTCYVAVTEDGNPCYMQWLMSAEQNEQIQSYFKGGFPLLKQNEGLLEFAFSSETFRGMRIMPHSMSEIAKQGKEFGAKWIITVVHEDNIPALKGCKRAGFFPYTVREDQWRFFRRQTNFRMLPNNTPYPFDDPTQL